MKKIVSLLLVFVMVLSSFSMAFAAGDAVVVETTKSNEQLAGEFLSTAGILKGEDGDLKLDAVLTREQGMLMIARLMGKEDEALNNKLTSTFKDAKNNAYWAPVVAWAESLKLTNGMGDGTFGLGKELRVIEYQTLALRVLGFEAKWDGTGLDAATVKTVEELGMMTAVGTTFNRGAMAIMTVNTLKATPKDAKETLAATLKVDMTKVPTFVVKVDPSDLTDVEVKSVLAVAADKMAVTFAKDVNTTKADFAVAEKADVKKVAEVKEVVAEGSKVAVVTFEKALTAGTAYTVTIAGKTYNFTGIAADATVPTVVKVSAVDTNTFVVEFSDRMDYTTATDVANYTFDKGLKATKAVLDSSRTKVTLTTDAAKRNIVYTLTIQNVKNTDAKVIAKVSRTITATEDRINPRVTTLRIQNNRMIEVKFVDANGMNQEALENKANYSINALEIESVKAYDVDEDGAYETVVLMTATQKANTAYTLTMENLTDDSVLKNPLGKTARGFRGASEDKSAPVVEPGSVKSENNNVVIIKFVDNNAIDKATAEDINNYAITYGNGEVLPIVSAKLSDNTYPSGYELKEVRLTTAQQDTKVSYRLEVKGVQDEFGVALKPITGTTYTKYNFMGSEVEVTAPYVTKVEFVNTSKVRLTFNKTVEKTSAQDPTNYSLNDLGSAIKAVRTKTDSKVVELTTQTQTGNKEYTVTINNVSDLYGNATSNAKAKFVSTPDTLDTTAPEITYIYAMNDSELHLNFSEKVVVAAGTTITVQASSNEAFDVAKAAKTFAYKGRINDGTTAVFTAVAATDKLAQENYKIKTMSANIEDLAKNNLIAYTYTSTTVLAPAMAERVIFSGNSAANIAPEIEYIEQIGTKTLRVHFTEPVLAVNGQGLTATKLTGNTYNEYVNAWDFKQTTNFKVGTAVNFNFTTLASDFVALGTKDAADTTTDSSKMTQFVPYFEDLTKPVITGVSAVHNQKVVVNYDEDIQLTGTYKIYYLNTNLQPVYVYTGGGTPVDNTVEVTLPVGTVLKGSNVYYLETVAGAKDEADNTEEKTNVKHDFPGTDVTVTDFITGVKITNAKNITLNATKAMTAITVYEMDNNTRVVKMNSAAANFAAPFTTKAGNILLDASVLAGKTYEAAVTFADGTTGTYRFNGITPDIGIVVSRTGQTTMSVNFAGFNSALYNYKIQVAPINNTAVIPAEIAGTVVDSLATPTNTFDDTITFNNATLNISTEVYVTLYDKNDATRVLYSAKVKPVVAAASTKVVKSDAELAAALTDLAVTNIDLQYAAGSNVTINRPVNILVTNAVNALTITVPAAAGSFEITGANITTLTINAPNCAVRISNTVGTANINAVSLSSYVATGAHTLINVRGQARVHLSELASNTMVVLGAGAATKTVQLAGTVGEVSGTAIAANLVLEAGTVVAKISATGLATYTAGAGVVLTEGTAPAAPSNGTVAARAALATAINTATTSAAAITSAAAVTVGTDVKVVSEDAMAAYTAALTLATTTSNTAVATEAELIAAKSNFDAAYTTFVAAQVAGTMPAAESTGIALAAGTTSGAAVTAAGINFAATTAGISINTTTNSITIKVTVTAAANTTVTSITVNDTLATVANNTVLDNVNVSGVDTINVAVTTEEANRVTTTRTYTLTGITHN